MQIVPVLLDATPLVHNMKTMTSDSSNVAAHIIMPAFYNDARTSICFMLLVIVSY